MPRLGKVDLEFEADGVAMRDCLRKHAFAGFDLTVTQSDPDASVVTGATCFCGWQTKSTTDALDAWIEHFLSVLRDE